VNGAQTTWNPEEEIKKRAQNYLPGIQRTEQGNGAQSTWNPEEEIKERA
jgi:hypothetical protein